MRAPRIAMATIPAIRIHHTMSKEDAKEALAYLHQHPTESLAEIGKTIAAEIARCFCLFCDKPANDVVGQHDSRALCTSCRGEHPTCSTCLDTLTQPAKEGGRCNRCYGAYVAG